MTRMHRTLLAILLLSGIAIAQSPTRSASKTGGELATADSKAVQPATVLPTEDTVNSFLFQMFGYDPTMTWKVNEIRPSEVPGLAEVTVANHQSAGLEPESVAG